MKRLFLSLALAAASFGAYAQTWNLDKAHSRVGFTIVHMMLTDVDGNFKSFDATLTAAKPDLTDAVFELTADASSIFTDNDRRDTHLKSPDFFDVAKFPTLNFKSTSFQKVEGKKYKLNGNLTMHGVTKPVSLDVIMNGPVTMENQRGKTTKVGFRASGLVKRSDFGVGSTGAMSPVSDEVELKINGEFAQAPAVAAGK